jgi:hypothetical protein
MPYGLLQSAFYDGAIIWGSDYDLGAIETNIITGRGKCAVRQVNDDLLWDGEMTWQYSEAAFIPHSELASFPKVKIEEGD